MSDQAQQGGPPQIPQKANQRILTPGQFKGMNTALAPSALQEGQFALVDNLRPDDGSLMCRYPTTNRSAGGLPTVSLSVSGLSNANPIVVTTSAAHHQATGNIVTIAGALGNTAANGTWPVTSTGADTFTIPVAGNGAYTSGATLTVNQWHGIWGGSLNGIEYVVGAVFDGAKVGIYFSTDGYTFTAASQTSGAYGDTRMTCVGAPFSFAPVNNPSDGNDYLVISNGVDQPRVFGPAGELNGSYLRTIQTEATSTAVGAGAPTWASASSPIGYHPAPAGFSSTVSATATGGHITVVSTTGYQFVELSLGDNIPAYTGTMTDYVVISLGATLETAGSVFQQLVFVNDSYSYDWWQFFRVDVSPDDATWTTISDPSSDIYNAPTSSLWQETIWNTAANTSALTGGVNGEQVAAFGIGQINSMPNVAYVRLVWVGQASSFLSGSYAWTLHGLFLGGNQLAFNYSWAVSNTWQNGTTESPGITYSTPNPNTSTAITFLAQEGVTGNIQRFLPYLAGVYYYHKIPVQVPPLANIQQGLDYVYIYQAQDSGGNFTDADYFYLNYFQVGIYTGGTWLYSATNTTSPPTAALQQYYDTGYYTGAVDNWLLTVNPNRYVPSTYVIPIPSNANVIASTPQRLFAGINGSLAFSENVQPFRFYSGAPAVNGSIPSQYGNTLPLPGLNVVALATTAGGTLGAYTVWAWTQTKTYMIQGFDCYSLSTPNEIAEVGVSCPSSVAAYKDVIWFLDDNLQLREFRYGRAAWFGIAAGIEMMPAISRFVVDNITTAIPKSVWQWVQGVAVFDRYYLAYPTPANASNLDMLIYEETRQCFIGDTLTEPAQVMDYIDVPAGRFLVYGGGGSLYTHEDVTSTTPQPVTLYTREGSSGMWDCLLWGRVGIVMDVQSGETLNITRAIKPNLTDASTLDLSTNATGQVWRWDTRSGDTVPGQSGLSCQLQMTWTMTPGTRLYTVLIETEPRRSGADML